MPAEYYNIGDTVPHILNFDIKLLSQSSSYSSSFSFHRLCPEACSNLAESLSRVATAFICIGNATTF
jgi:hypothetical protein